MGTNVHSHEWVREDLRNKLALAVRSIQWSYGIFWSISSTQSGVLEWGDGYYNGDIKTRRTIQSIELDPDQMGLQRSEQLRELYESLATADTKPQVKRPSAALSPEDLSDTEWYYLVCMSFAFNIGQGIPGRTYESGETIWMCNAHTADSKVFTRSLLAKSASIQTVLCFPFLDGVIELGVTDMVSKDLSLVNHIKTNFLERTYPIFSDNFLSNRENTHFSQQQPRVELEEEMLDTKFRPLMESGVGDINMDSPYNSSNELYPNHLADDFFMVDEINDEEFVNSIECISQSIIATEKVLPVGKDDQLKNHNFCQLDIKNDDSHYTTTLSSIFKTSDPLVLRPHFENGDETSSFVSWKSEGFSSSLNPKCGLKSQKLLKKVLFQVAKMHDDGLIETYEETLSRPDAEERDINDATFKKRRPEKLNKRFSILRSLIPSKNKVDKVSVLNDTIEYLKELEKRVEELDPGCTKKHQETSEKTSDINYEGSKICNHKRKASDLDETEAMTAHVSSRDFSSSDTISVSMIENNVLIEMKCSWRECLLFEIIEAVSNLHLDSQSVQSSTANGLLSLTIKSKLKGSKMVSAAKIRQTLKKIVQK